MIRSLRRRVFRYRQQKIRFLKAEERGAPDYGVYFFKGSEKLAYSILCVLLMGFLAIFFYRSCRALPLLAPVGAVAYLSMQKEKGISRKRKLELEFKDCIQLTAANLRAGYSVENAFMECEKDMTALYGQSGLMVRELRRIRKGLCNNIPLEQQLSDLGQRSASDHIREFSEVFAIGRLCGGNLSRIIQTTAGQIAEEISLKQEILTTVSGKKLEHKIMTIIPFCMMGYIEVSNPGFFDVLYHNLLGYAVMTASLAVYLAAWRLGKKICRITV